MAGVPERRWDFMVCQSREPSRAPRQTRFDAKWGSASGGRRNSSGPLNLIQLDLRHSSLTATSGACDPRVQMISPVDHPSQISEAELGWRAADDLQAVRDQTGG